MIHIVVVYRNDKLNESKQKNNMYQTYKIVGLRTEYQNPRGRETAGCDLNIPALQLLLDHCWHIS